MSDNPLYIGIATVAIIALSALFVAAEFSLIAAKRHRVEDAAARSAPARAALRNFGELQLVLAGSQLGITVCTLALGAITKPAVHHWLEPVMESIGLPSGAASVVSFILALFVVTFLHLVIGEMAPKSWAIAHPEMSATVLAIPMRAFMAITRPLLRALNRAANALVRRVGVVPTDSLSASQNPDELRHLVEHSINVGALDAEYAEPIEAVLQLQVVPLREIVRHDADPEAVSVDATVADVRDVARRTGHRRILMASGGDFTAVVHVRDTMAADPQVPAADFRKPLLRLPASMTLHAGLAEMRRTRKHLAVVVDGAQTLGVVTMADVLTRLAPAALGSTMAAARSKAQRPTPPQAEQPGPAADR